ncbi:MAG: hypothetical protein LBR29_06180, partial [Methylobacteriaceae bacterium]|jgi:hypothetical protein|nr:hypothetical protein [Methylobacteriaceae bacterium]
VRASADPEKEFQSNVDAAGAKTGIQHVFSVRYPPRVAFVPTSARKESRITIDKTAEYMERSAILYEYAGVLTHPRVRRQQRPTRAMREAAWAFIGGKALKSALFKNVRTHHIHLQNSIVLCDGFRSPAGLRASDLPINHKNQGVRHKFCNNRLLSHVEHPGGRVSG